MDTPRTPDCPPDGPPELNRRTALAIVVGVVGALATGAVGLVAGFLGNALGRKAHRPWIRIGKAEDLDSESFQRYLLHAEHHHAWIDMRKPLTVYVKDLYPQDPLALLSTCSHLGCSVKWVKQERSFRCPCHGGVYDEQGQVVSGPPPRPLTQLEVKVEDDICFVRMPGAESKDATV